MSSKFSITSPSLPSNLESIRAEVTNWGRWGEEDERGCANLLDLEATKRGLATVERGETISLALPLGPEGPQLGQPAHRINAELTTEIANERDPHAPGVWASSDDTVRMSTSAGTHIDTLAHVSYDGLIWNGFPAASINLSDGATRCGAETLSPILTRAIVIDLPRLRSVAGLDEIDPGFAIGADELDEACAAASLRPAAGDVLLIRTGFMRHLQSGDRERYTLGDQYRFPGLGIESLKWLRKHDIVGAFTDTYAFESFPPASPDWRDTLGVHMINIRDIGAIQGQNWDLEVLSLRCAEMQRWEVLLSASPEPIVGATSAPVAPVAVV